MGAWKQVAMSAEPSPRAAAGSAMAAWSAKALLITAGAFLVGGAIWYARAATVPLIVAALISTQLLPLIDLATRRGMSRGLAVAASMLLVVLAGLGLAWVFGSLGPPVCVVVGGGVGCFVTGGTNLGGLWGGGLFFGFVFFVGVGGVCCVFSHGGWLFSLVYLFLGYSL